MPMINEAIYSLYEGVAGVKEIDEVMEFRYGSSNGTIYN